MRKTFAIFGLTCLALYIALLTVLTVSPIRLFGNGRWFEPQCDIRIWLVEASVVRKGTNPYDVWSGKVILNGYKPGVAATIPDETLYKADDEAVCVNPPWLYAAMLPLSFLPWRAAAALYFGIMMACLGLLVLIGFCLARRYGLDRCESVVASTASVLAIALPLLQDFGSANCALLVIVAAVMMAIMLERGRDIAAGFCWAIVMLKPQVGLIFAVPLLMKRRVKTCAVASATCVLATMVPAWLTQTSPITLILNTTSANQGLFWGSGTMPSFICALMPMNIANAIGVAIGALVCIWQTRKVLSTGINDWLLVITPAAICSMCWTYARCYSHVAAWFFFVWLCIALKRSGYDRRYVVLGIVALLPMTRIFSGVHCALVHLNSIVLPGMDWVAKHFETIDTLNSTVDLILAVSLMNLIIRDGLLEKFGKTTSFTVPCPRVPDASVF